MLTRVASLLVVPMTLAGCSVDDVDSDIPSFSADLALVHSGTYAFGQVAEGEVVRHDFTFTNTGSAPVRITSYQAACGCTVPTPPEGPIAPGETVTIPATLNTKGKSGPVEQVFTCTADTGRAHSFRFEGFVSAKTLRPIEFDPVKRGEDKRFPIDVPVYAAEPWEVKSVDYDAAKLRVEETGKTRSGYTYEAVLAPDAPYGDFASEIVFETTDPLNPRKTVAVSGHLRYPVEAEPADVALGVIEAGKKSEGRTRIHSPYGYAVTIDSVELARGEAVTWEVVQVSDSAWDIVVSVGERTTTDLVFSAELHIAARAGEEFYTKRIDVHGIGSSALPKRTADVPS